jgi:hypothetical protein
MSSDSPFAFDGWPARGQDEGLADLSDWTWRERRKRGREMREEVVRVEQGVENLVAAEMGFVKSRWPSRSGGSVA